MRTTVDLPADLHAQAVAIARDTHRTLSDTVALLMRRGLGEGQPSELTHSAATGLPVVRLGRMITTEDVRSLEDDLMPAVLIDANVLIALVVDTHVHHGHAEAWFTATGTSFATCPITQGSLIRLLVREGQTAAAAGSVLRGVATNPRHEFWPDDVPYTDVPTVGIVGHRQVTDAYLAQLARAHAARLATFDQALAKLHADIAELVPTG